MKSPSFLSQLFILALLLAPVALCAQGKKLVESKFTIQISKADGKIKMACTQGCAWTTLSFDQPGNGSAILIDEYGMQAPRGSVKEEGRDQKSSFLFSVKSSKEGFQFKGVNGTSWEDLKFSCATGKCNQAVNQDGMVAAQ